MDSITRIIPFVWPYRRKILLSLLFAILTALFWGANLSVAFPIVKVLLQGQSLDDYVASEIEATEQEIADRTEQLKTLDGQIEALKGRGSEVDDGELVHLLTIHSRQQKKISNASRSLLAMNWVRSYVMPWVPADQFDTFALIVALLLAATVLKGICIFMQDVLVGSVVELTVMSIRKECFRRTLALDYQSLAMDGTANLMSRFTNDFTIMSSGLLLLGGKVIREPLKAVMCLAFAFLVNWQLTLLSMLFVPLMGIIFYRYGRLLKHASHRMMDSMSRIYKSLEETFDAIKVVIAFDGARRHRIKFHRENKAYYNKAMKVVKVDALTSPTTELIGLLAVFIALLPGSYLVLRGTNSIWGFKLAPQPMDIATLSLLYAFLAGTLDPIRKLSSVYSKLKRSTAAMDRILMLLDRQSLVQQSQQPVALGRLSHSIAFEDVTFIYAGRDEHGKKRPPALAGVNLNVAAGEVIAVVGENGSGKSTLVNLLPRYYDCDQGAVRIDGTDIRDASLRELRGQIGVVTQETLLFDDTIYENIRYGKPSATPAEIERAAERAHVTRFVGELPDGFQTVVGQKGQRLSGGQRQRIALARAILRDPAILILDEATSAIDAQSELLIHQALREFAAGRTTFIITHYVSRSMLDFVTRIAVMDQGHLVAAGPHEQLIETCPVYRKLYTAQLRHPSPDDEGASDGRRGDKETRRQGEGETGNSELGTRNSERGIAEIESTDQSSALCAPRSALGTIDEVDSPVVIPFIPGGNAERRRTRERRAEEAGGSFSDDESKRSIP